MLTLLLFVRMQVKGTGARKRFGKEAKHWLLPKIMREKENMIFQLLASAQSFLHKVPAFSLRVEEGFCKAELASFKFQRLKLCQSVN